MALSNIGQGIVIIEDAHDWEDIIPSRWKKVRLGDICTLRTETVNPSKNANCKYIGLEHIDPGNTQLSRWGRASEVQSSKSRFYTNDVLYGKLRPYLDKAVQAEFDGICSTDILVLVTNKAADSGFLSYLVHMRNFIYFAMQTTKGVNHPRTSWSSLAQFEFVLPPPLEQRTIAHILQTAQNAIRARRKELELERERKTTLMQHLFTHGTWGEPTKQTEIGEMPESWEIVRVDSIIASGPQNGIYKHHSFYGQGNLIIRINDFDNEGEIISGGSNRVTLSISELEEYRLNLNDILINRVNSISHLGKSTLIGALKEDNVFESNMMRLTVNTTIVEPEYTFRYLNSNQARAQIQGKARHAVAQCSINQEDVKSLLFPLPPLAVQHGIVSTLHACDCKITALEKEIALQEELFRALLDELMTGRLSTLPLVE